MKRLILRRAAIADIEEIWDYTERTWGIRQAAAYDERLRAVIDGLRSGTARSKPADHLRSGLRRALAERHVAYFLEAEATLTVIRVLHQRMEPGRRM